MKTLILALFSVAALSAAMPTPAQEKEVMAAMDSWIQATVKQDITGLQRNLARRVVVFALGRYLPNRG